LRIGRRLETGRRSESYIYNVLFFSFIRQYANKYKAL
jgi:hypothetical protein